MWSSFLWRLTSTGMWVPSIAPMQPSKWGANGWSSICTPLYSGSDGTMIVFDQVFIICDISEHLRLIVSKDLSNLSFASLTAASWPHVQMKITKASLESHWLVLFSPNPSTKMWWKCRKASLDMRRLSKHLLWSLKVICSHCAPVSFGNGHGGFSLGPFIFFNIFNICSN
jgi:hypothetical protein